MKELDLTLLTEKDKETLEKLEQLKSFIPEKDFIKIKNKIIKCFIKRNKKEKN